MKSNKNKKGEGGQGDEQNQSSFYGIGSVSNDFITYRLLGLGHIQYQVGTERG